jgi:hypothetical protein
MIQQQRTLAMNWEMKGVRDAFGVAIGLHVFLLIWNPVLMKSKPIIPQEMLMQVEYREVLPPPPPEVKAEPKKKAGSKKGQEGRH